MKGLFFGSIGSVIETSELQRKAFNLAFEDHGLDWHWDNTTYCAMLSQSGGNFRIQNHAQKLGQVVDAIAIHQTKSQYFNSFLESNRLFLRKGVVESLLFALDKKLKTAFVSTTLNSTIQSIMKAENGVLKGLFSLVTSEEDKFCAKPAPEAYLSVCKNLGILPKDVLAVEDNQAGLISAYKAGLNVIAYLGENTKDCDVSMAGWFADEDIFPSVVKALNF